MPKANAVPVKIPGLPSLTNIVSIISKQWIVMLKPGGFKIGRESGLV
jgi:hypothetical protein